MGFFLAQGPGVTSRGGEGYGGRDACHAPGILKMDSCMEPGLEMFARQKIKSFRLSVSISASADESFSTQSTTASHSGSNGPRRTVCCATVAGEHVAATRVAARRSRSVSDATNHSSRRWKSENAFTNHVITLSLLAKKLEDSSLWLSTRPLRERSCINASEQPP